MTGVKMSEETKKKMSESQKNKKLNTTKADKSNHGYGLKSVKRLAEQSGGLADIFEEDGMFVVRIEFFSKNMSFVPKNM